MDYPWLIFNTKLCNWLITRSSLAKSHNQTKRYNYTIIYNEQVVYKIDLKLSKQDHHFVSKIYKNNKCLYTIQFRDPIEWYHKITKACQLSSDINDFIYLLLKTNMLHS